MPWWLSAFTVAAAVWILHGLYRDVFGNLWAMLPMIGIVGYLVTALALNRTQVRVDREGFRRSFGPVPIGMVEAPVPAGEVKRVVVRWAMASTGRSVAKYLAAGLETRSGRLVDITEPGETEEAVWRAAREMAEALGRGVPVEAIGGRGVQIDQPTLRMVLAWAGGFAASIFWAIAVQLVRSFF